MFSFSDANYYYKWVKIILLTGEPVKETKVHKNRGNVGDRLARLTLDKYVNDPSAGSPTERLYRQRKSTIVYSNISYLSFLQSVLCL